MKSHPSPPLLSQITTLLTTLHTPLSSSLPLTLTLASRSSSSGNKTHTLTFPAHARQFAIYLTLLSSIHTLLTTNSTATKRDLYYRNVPLFQHQRVVDTAIDDLAATLRVRRSDLHVVAAARGVYIGDLTIVLKNRERITGVGGIIPSGIDGVELRELQWALLVEKEAVFQRLERSWKGGVLVTGKGYPDLATRELLAGVESAGGKVMALVDLDPDGLEIVGVVRHGGQRMGHEGSAVRAAGVRRVGIGWEEVVAAVKRGGGEGLVRMSMRDRRRAVRMLERGDGGVDADRECLQRLLFVGVKAEIEILGDRLVEWVQQRVAEVLEEG